MKSPFHGAVIVLFVSLVMSSCTIQTTQEEMPLPVTMASTATVTAALRPEPTFTATRAPVVSFEGPKLIYITYNQSEGRQTVYMMNSDGTARQELALPPDFEIRSLKDAVSPDGKWIAFHTGSPDNRELTLNLFSMETGESIAITSLLSPDYPENFQKAFERIQSSSEDFFNKGSISPETLEKGFDLTRVSWSPDSRFLAFAGEMDGPTSDLYLYDMENQTIRRMFDDLLNISSLEWADDGQVIFFSNIVPGEIYSWTLNYAVHVGDGHIQEFDAGGWDTIDTCFESKFCFFHYQGDGGDPLAISYLDVASGESRELWGPTFQDYAIGPQSESIIVSGPYGEDPEPGTYFVDFTGERKKVSDIFFLRFTYWNAKEPCFLGAVPEGMYRIALDGNVQKVFEKDYYEFSISPNGKWLVAHNEDSPYVDSNGLLLLNNKLEVVKVIGDKKTNYISWQPDSSGLFFTTENLYHVSIPDGELQLLEFNTNVRLGEHDHRWIP